MSNGSDVFRRECTLNQLSHCNSRKKPFTSLLDEARLTVPVSAAFVYFAEKNTESLPKVMTPAVYCFVFINYLIILAMGWPMIL